MTVERSFSLLMGAVCYDPKVVTIWEGFREYFSEHSLNFDYVLYSNYERQVEAQLAGHVHVAWNSPLAWLQTQAGAVKLGRTADPICMRDSDRNLTSVILVRANSGFEKITDLIGRRIGVGAKDSPQAYLIPLNLFADAGLWPDKQIDVVSFDILVGKHGDHIGGERAAVEALLSQKVDAACVIDTNYLAFSNDGLIPLGAVKSIARTPKYDHCNFTVVDNGPTELIERFRSLLLGMSYSDPKIRRLFDLEGLKRWVPGRVEGYQQLASAAKKFGGLSSICRRSPL